MPRPSAALLCGALTLLAGAAGADEAPPAVAVPVREAPDGKIAPWVTTQHPGQSLTFQMENDGVIGTDRHYTNGTRIAWLSGPDQVPDFAQPLYDVLPSMGEYRTRRIGFEIGQSIYTPEDIDAKGLQPNDRPYAGWLYGSMSLLSDEGTHLDSYQLQLGVVGPPSLAAETQKFVHRIIGDTNPQGWGNQLNTEPGAVLYYQRKWRTVWDGQPGGFGADLIPHTGAAVGNVFTYAAAGITLRVGEDLRADYGAPRVRPSMPGSDFFEPRQGWGWYLFAGVEGRLVARDITLDGNTFEDSHSVTKIPWVGDLQGGLAVTVANVRLTYTHVLQTKTFYKQSGLNQFGALAASFRF